MSATQLSSPTRRDLLTASFAAVVASATLPTRATAKQKVAASTKDPGDFKESHVVRDGHKIYVRDYSGGGPAFVMVHGFPDNCRIYKEVAAKLSAAGRRVVTFDFLGFGISDKPKNFAYSFDQQLADMTAVVDGMNLEMVIPVGHDAGGPAAVNYAISHADQSAGLVLLNSYYSNDPSRAFPDFIELCCNPKTQKLAHAMMTDPKMAGYLFQFQQGLLMANMTADLKAKFLKETLPIIATNFTQKESAMPAFLQMTGDAYANIDANDRRMNELKTFPKPVKFIWGTWDKYLSTSLAKEMAGHFTNAEIVELETEHWPQLDRPGEVVKAMLEMG